MFADVADDIVHWLSGRAVVAFNGNFDLRFLQAEFMRLGVALPDIPLIDLRAFCGGTLAMACADRGIAIEDQYTALGDAYATDALLRVLAGEHHLDGAIVDAPPSHDAWPRLLYERTEVRRHAAGEGAESEPVLLPSLFPGCAVCFTGDSGGLILGNVRLVRDDAEHLAVAAGFVVKSAVSKKLTLLVAADVHSLSGKAAKARALGIPSISEVAFWTSLGYHVST